MSAGIHFNLDHAWNPALLPLRSVDASVLGPHLRYTAPEHRLAKAFAVFQEALREDRFVLYGSGDFHHLAAWWLKAALDLRPPSAAGEKITLISFDNHPDWDVRPPRWGCGGWINRALEFPQVQNAAVWGCGNFELAFPARLFRNRKALAERRLSVNAWAERQSPGVAKMFNCMTRENWRERFAAFAKTLAPRPVYVTIDIDALDSNHAVTNWEAGLFTPEDIAWALAQIRANTSIFAGDLCGAYSPPSYARRIQRLIGKFDHPPLPVTTLEAAQKINHAALATLWPALSDSQPRRWDAG